ncbi:MAG: hypothetical protein JSV79_10920, partial [Armatimonadota bacterium]
MSKSTALRLTVSVLLMVIGVCGPIRAAESASGWGVVDMERISAEYRGMHELNRQFQDFQREQDELLEKRYKTRALRDDERQEYLDRSDMGPPT